MENGGNMHQPSKDEINEYNKDKSETEKWVMTFAKYIIGLSGATLSLTLGAVLNNPGNAFLLNSTLLKWSWLLLGLSVLTSCVFIGVVIASTYVYLERRRAYMYKESSRTPEYPRWNERTRNIASLVSVVAFAAGFVLIGVVLIRK
jgi:hypothetical protein